MNRVRPTQVTKIRNGAAGTKDTLRIMRNIIRKFRKNPLIRQVALDIVRQVPEKDYAAEVQAVQQFVKQRIRYTRDPVQVECVQWPTYTLEQGQGDCDDSTILIASLLEAIGHPTCIRAISVNPLHPNQFCHVMAMTRLDNPTRWVSVETTLDVPMGWMPPDVTNTLDSLIA